MKRLINFISNYPKLHNKVTEELYSFTPKTLISSVLLATIFILIFWNEVQNNTYLLTWYGFLLLLSITRFFDYKRYQKKEKKASYWYDYFKLKSLIQAGTWGILPVLFLTDLHHNYQVLMLFFILAVAIAVTIFISDFSISSTLITVLLAPIFVMFFFSNIPFVYLLQTLIFIFYSLLLSANKHFNLRFYQMYKSEERYLLTKKMLLTKEKKLSALLDQAPIGIFYYDNNFNIHRSNSMFKKLFSSKNLEHEVNNFNLNNLKDKEIIKLLKYVLEVPTEKETLGSFNFSLKNEPIWIELTCSSLLNNKNEIIGGIGTIEDKTIEHSTYEKINYISLHDALTSLPNRRSYQEYMKELITKVEHIDHYSFLFYMDLNHFKQINDTFGHVVGDKVLLEAASRLKHLNIKKKFLSRIGGDEFIMLIPFYTKNMNIAKKEAESVAFSIKDVFNDAFYIEGLDLYMTTSIGIVIIEPNSNDTEQIIRQADMAMYQTKREGLNNIRFYDQSLDLKQQELTSLQHDLKIAIENNELELYYQPIVSIHNNTLNAVEALIRWNHPTKGLIMPDKYIPMATESGLITKVGWWVAREVCKQLATWKEANIINFEYISININARQLNEINFVDHLANCIKKGGINPSLLKLDLTETTLLDNFTKTQMIIKNLKDKGIECSIDDFGTGYSSLSYLKKIAFKVLKIDKIFVKDMLTNPDSQELIKSIIAIGKQFNYKIIIEGVEKEEQRQQLIKIDDRIYYQGFLYSKAIPAKEFEQKFLTFIYHI